jgi:hypothetical protein
VNSYLLFGSGSTTLAQRSDPELSQGAETDLEQPEDCVNSSYTALFFLDPDTQHWLIGRIRSFLKGHKRIWNNLKTVTDPELSKGSDMDLEVPEDCVNSSLLFGSGSTTVAQRSDPELSKSVRNGSGISLSVAAPPGSCGTRRKSLDETGSTGS